MSKAERNPWPIFGDLREIDGFICHTKASFEKNPRSKAIRDISVGITRSLAQLLWDKTLAEDDREVLKSSSQQLGESLVALGITQSIHVGRKPKTFWRTPVVVAEFVAGQLLPYSGYEPPSEKKLEHLIAEFNHLEGGIEDYAIQTEQAPNRLVDFWVDGWIVGNAIRELDCYEEVRFEKYKEGLFIGQ